MATNVLTEAEQDELTQLRDEVIAKSGVNIGQPRHNAPKVKVERLAGLEDKIATAGAASDQAQNGGEETKKVAADMEDVIDNLLERICGLEQVNKDAEGQDGDGETKKIPADIHDIVERLTERVCELERINKKILNVLSKQGILKSSRYLQSKGMIKT